MNEPHRTAARPYAAWFRRQRRDALIGALLVVAAGAVIVAVAPRIPWSALPLVLLPAAALYLWMTRRARRRAAVLAEPFPAEWEAVLHQDVVFFRTLDDTDKVRFRRDLQVFLGETRITGIKTDIDTTTEVLVGASAVIPIFGFPEWEWDEISEVLVYPDRFGRDFQLEGAGRSTLGMVGTGYLSRTMLLSKPDLIQGFRNPGDKRNVGVHEFAHLVDKTDGGIDGVPPSFDREAVGPWVELMRRKMLEIHDGDSDIDPYALTNRAEFFAVTSEYFFERPGIMERKHPELYAMLSKAFRQDLGRRTMSLADAIRLGRPEFGRNSPCPCGSGTKYKKCCLKKRRRGRRR